MNFPISIDKIQQQLTEQDPILDDIIAQIPFPQIESSQQVFHDLMSCVIEQQIHYRSSKKTFQKIMNASKLDILSVENFHILEEHGLRTVKLNERKYETMFRVVEFFQQNEINWQEKSDEEVREILGQIKGIGQWTTDMILLYTLERENIFPADDYHLRLMMTKLYEIDSSARVKAQ
jgi:DNA-3-methyladenine glycosylase II